MTLMDQDRNKTALELVYEETKARLLFKPKNTNYPPLLVKRSDCDFFTNDSVSLYSSFLLHEIYKDSRL